MKRIRIGDWAAIPSLNVVERDGVSIKLEPRAMDLLVHLAEARGRVVSADELLRDVWQGRVFDDGIVYSKINQLRKALGDDSPSQRLIETIPKRGYRLAADVDVIDEPGAQQGTLAAEAPSSTTVGHGRHRRARHWRWSIPLAASGLALAMGGAILHQDSVRSPPPRSVAVLPCENLSTDSENALAPGVHEELIEQLAKAGFEVKARTAVMQYAGLSKPPPEIARELDVGAIMECSVQQIEGRVKVHVALVDAATGNTRWREAYDRQLVDVFAIESDMARNVARALEMQLSSNQIDTLDKIPSQSPRAIELYYSARRYEQLGVLNWAQAAEQYEKAVAEDPQFARAWAQLALLRTLMSGIVQRPSDAMERARVAAQTALAIDPGIVQGRVAMLAYQVHADSKASTYALTELNALEPEAQRSFEYYAIRRSVKMVLGDAAGALDDATRAVELGPPRDLPLLLWRGYVLTLLHRYDEAEIAFKHAADIAPDDFGARLNNASLPWWRDGDTKALRALAADLPPGRLPNDALWQAPWMDRDYDTVLRSVDAALAAPDQGNNMWGRLLTKGVVAYNAGRIELSRSALEAARDRLSKQLETPVGTAERINMKIGLAVALSYLGEKNASIRNTDEAMSWLDHALPGEAQSLRLQCAFAYASAGAVDKAVALLDDHLSRPTPWSIEGLVRFPHLDPIRDDPRFVALVEKYQRR